MSVVRAILGRFARFLVRIARTLDPGIAAAPYWVMPERMAALRARYPGAPEHWLELLARRTTLADGGPAPAYRPEREARPDLPRPGFNAAEPASHPAPRPALRFPIAQRRAPVVARPGVASSAVRPDGEASHPAPRPVRPLLTFAVTHVRNPIANLLRGRSSKERPVAPRFPFDDRAPAPDRAGHDQAGHDAPREHVTIFPASGSRSAQHPEWGAPTDPRRAPDAGPSWPEFRYSAPPGPSWPGSAPRAERPSPRFAGADDRWPELPPFLDEAGAAVQRATDEVALLAEQIGGTWSA